MAEVKWIKLSTELFNNRKIKQIECLPEGNAVIVMWVKLLCLAGTINDSGQVYFTKEIPYTEQMLSTQFGMQLATVQLGLKIFEQFGMVEVIDDILCISNWEKYQNVESLATIREQNRKRVAKHREKKRLEQSNVTCNVTVTQRNAIDIDKDKEEDKEIDNIYIPDSEPEKPKKEKPVRHKYGEYNNVLLSDEDMNKLQAEFPTDYEERIERLSSYMASTGKSYKNHLATIRNWARKDKGCEQQQKQAETPVKYNPNIFI
jgi:predicted phage replisome organizer